MQTKMPCDTHLQTSHDRLFDVWKICEKLRLLLRPVAKSLRYHFQQEDPCHIGSVPTDKFASILFCLVTDGAVSKYEICKIARYFEVSGNRTSYYSFCDTLFLPPENDEPCAGRSISANPLSVQEHRQLSLILLSIAQALRFREHILRPYFEEYSLVTRAGPFCTVRFTLRVLYYLGVTLAKRDKELFVKRFAKDGHRFDYGSFIEEIEQLFRFLDQRDGALDRRHDDAAVPPKIIETHRPKVERPEIGSISVAELCGKRPTFHPFLSAGRKDQTMQELLLRIQRHIWENRIRIKEVFQQHDPFRCGWITSGQFIRCLDLIGLSRLHRLPLHDRELKQLCERYADSKNPNQIRWMLFLDEICRMYSDFPLDTEASDLTTPASLKNVQPLGKHETTSEEIGQCEVILRRIRQTIASESIMLEPVLKDFDKHRNGHISFNQLRKAFAISRLALTDEEAFLLDKIYGDDRGFYYIQFLKDIQVELCSNQPASEYLMLKKLINRDPTPPEPTASEKDIVLVLAKVKAQAVYRRLRLLDSMEGFDPLHHHRISATQFARGLSTASIKLSPCEMELLCDYFRTPLSTTIDYRRFCDTIAEIDYQPKLEKAPLLVPCRHFPADETSSSNFLNFDDRTIVSKALQKLARHADLVTNMRSQLKDFDPQNVGHISRNRFLRVLTSRDLHTRISSREFEKLCNYFAVEIGHRQEVNYRALMEALDYLYTNREVHPF
uniref:EF-hand domain-containing protein n=1 Tax=Anopheles albimanus TaxID=7167 RepID=A0A8W7K8D3_ANOAL